MRFTVVMPTFNRMDILPEALDAVEAMEDDDFDLVIVNDGSSDGTQEFLDSRSFKVPVRIVHQANAGPAKARNCGVKEASGKIVAFLGDDTVPEVSWLAQHRAVHAARDYDPTLAVIGYTAWHLRMRLNPFLRYINDWGLQFGYAIIPDPEKVPFNFFYTSNLSLHRDMLLAEPFDESFPYASWEDIEAGYRMQERRGMHLVYNKEAVVAHDHPTTIARFASRQEKAGYSAVVFYKRHPELGGFLGLGENGPPSLPSEWRIHLLTEVAAATQNLPLDVPKLWDNVFRYHYMRGLHRGWQDLFAASPGS